MTSEYCLLCPRGGRRRPGPPAWPAVWRMLLLGAIIGAVRLYLYGDEVGTLPGCSAAGLVEVRTERGVLCLRPEQIAGRVWR